MNTASALIIAFPMAMLLASGAIPNGWANRHGEFMRRFVMLSAGLAFGAALIAIVLLVARGTLDIKVFQVNVPLPLSIGLYFDSLAAVMFLLVSFIGFVVIRFSLRYLDGDATQGRFMRWISVTLGAALVLIVSSNLAMFTGAWILTSFGLHQLLTHYADRSAAIHAAQKKFLISRLGDLMLLLALYFTYQKFGTFEYSEVFEAANRLRENVNESWTVSLIGTLYVFGAITKSAQFPFHSWLPDTMETPTPVSAFMHAGIINAGGYLVLRLSPLVSLSNIALDTLALVGAITALFGGTVMLTQTNIKRSLAYSTIAQMGIMMLQCGLGAFSAALLHIVAHSLYKAYAFLNCGSVLDTASRTKVKPHSIDLKRSLVCVVPAMALAAIIVALFSRLHASVLGHATNTLAMEVIFGLALTHLLWNSFVVWRWRIAIDGVLLALWASFCYVAAWTATDLFLSSSVSQVVIAPSYWDRAVIGLVVIGFIFVLGLQIALVHFRQWPPLQSLYIHTSNGFYLDIAVQKLTTRIWRSLPA